MYGDLHLHTNISDGSMSFDEVMQAIAVTSNNKPTLISIVDHNIFSVKSVIRNRNILILPGIELSATESLVNVHLTAYFKEITDTRPLDHLLSTIRDGYMQRARQIYEKIIASGYRMPPFDKMRPSNLPKPIYSHDIFEAFRVMNGQAAFEEQKKLGLFFVEEDNFLPTIKETIDAVHAMGGIIFWAHPGTRFLKTINGSDDTQSYESTLKILLAYKLDGIEAYYPSHTKQQRKRFLDDARTYSLLISGGSDFHGAYGSRKAPQLILPPEDTKKILQRLSITE